jgi:hypothetical protein
VPRKRNTFRSPATSANWGSLRETTALIRRTNGTTGFTNAQERAPERAARFEALPDGSFQPIKLCVAPSAGKAVASYRIYQEQIKEGAWNRLIGPDKIRAKEAKHIPFAG